MITNPTSGKVRGTDSFGSGNFHASRAGRLHEGLDMCSTPGQVVLSPIYGFVVREKRPYGDGGEYDTGLLIEGHGEHAGLQVTLFYTKPLAGVIGRSVKAGEWVGLATSLQSKYPGITDHVHLGVKSSGAWVDPAPLIQGMAA